MGLTEFGRPAGFMERQLRRWSKQWEATKIAELPALDALLEDLLRDCRRSASTRSSTATTGSTTPILHPTQPGSIVAVLDWEMSSLGDPFTDFGALLAFWSEDGDPEVLRDAASWRP